MSEREIGEVTAAVKSLEGSIDRYHSENREDHRLIFEKFDTHKDYVDAKIKEVKALGEHYADKKINNSEKKMHERYGWTTKTRNWVILAIAAVLVTPIISGLVNKALGFSQ